MKTVLITGCAGFLGTNLSLFHLRKGDNVLGIDNIISGLESNVKFLKSRYPDKFSFVKTNVGNIKSEVLDAKFDLSKIDLIYHLASPASPPIYQKYWKETISANTFELQILLEWMKENHPQAKFLFASTSEIYGQPLIVPQHESYNGNVRTIGPRSVYDESKRLGETITYEFYAKEGLDTKISRIHNTYGPFFNIDDGRVIVNFIQQSLQNKPITVYGDGSQKRCYTYVSDMIRGLNLLIESNYHEPVNLGSTDKFTILETAQIVKHVTNSKSEIVFQGLPVDDPLDREPVLKTAYEQINWYPVIDFSIGLERTIAYVIGELQKRGILK